MKRTVAGLALLLSTAAPDGAWALDDMHRGPTLALELGFHNPIGSGYDGWDPGLALAPKVGWRILSRLAIEGSFYSASSNVKEARGDGGIAGILVDARFFPTGAGLVEPNFFVGYSPLMAATAKVDATRFTVTGFSPIVGLGVRLHPMNRFFGSVDLRYHYVRYTRQSAKGGGIDESGSTGRQLHGDDYALLVGGGIAF